jgi:hypothetical protein
MAVTDQQVQQAVTTQQQPQTQTPNALEKVYEGRVIPPRAEGYRPAVIRESRIKERPYKPMNDSLSIKIELDLEVEVDLYARVKGDVMIGLLWLKRDFGLGVLYDRFVSFGVGIQLGMHLGVILNEVTVCIFEIIVFNCLALNEWLYWMDWKSYRIGTDDNTEGESTAVSQKNTEERFLGCGEHLLQQR